MLPRANRRQEFLIGHDRLRGGSISVGDRELLYHLLLIGSSGSGKSRGLIENLIQQIAKARPRRGCLFLDPHGSAFNNLKRWFARHPRFRNRVYFFDINDTSHFFGYNPLERRPGIPIDQQVNQTVEAIKRVCGAEPEDVQPRLERWSRNTLMIAANHGLTFPQLRTVLEDAEMRMYLVDETDDRDLQAEWSGFEALKRQQDRWNYLEAFLNRLSRIVTQHSTNILGQPKTTLPLWQAMEEGRLILMNLLPRNVGSEFARLFGMMLCNEILNLAKRRVPDVSRPFYLIVDEAAEFASTDLAKSFEILRKFCVGTVLCCQELEQLKDEEAMRLYASALTNTETKVIYSVSARDAEVLVPELFAGEIRGDRVKRENYHTLFAPRESRRKVTQRSWMEAAQEGEADMTFTSSMDGAAVGSGFGQSVPDIGAMGMLHFSDTHARHGATAGGDGHSRGTSRTTARGESEAIVPFYEYIRERELTGVDYFSPDELIWQFRSWLVNQEQRCFQFKRRGQSPILAGAPYVRDEWASKRLIRRLEAGTRALCLSGGAVRELMEKRDCLLLDYRNEGSLRQLSAPQ